MKSESAIFKFIPYVFMTLLVTFLLSTSIIGGDAMSGKIENSKYFVWDSIKKRKIQWTVISKQ